MQYRHGDVMIERIGAVPTGARPQPHTILAHGELTGHSHRIEEKGVAKLYHHDDGQTYLDVTADFAALVHQEHGDIPLPRGAYRVWRQREYSPQEIRFIRD